MSHDDNCYPSSDMRFWTYIGTRFGSKEQERRETRDERRRHYEASLPEVSVER